VSPLDWTVMLGTLAAFVGYGLWRSRETRDLAGFLVAGREMPWPMVLVSVMATQASAVTFLATPGQGYVSGLSFVQFYLGLPLAMVVLCATLVPLYQRLRVQTAYEFLERRFDGKTRTLATALFLTQRGLAAGITLYAPSLLFSVVLGWDIHWTCLGLGLLVVTYTTLGGSRAVGHTHALQFTIIMATMAVAFLLVLRGLPAGVGFGEAMAVAGREGKLEALEWSFDPASRYNLWAGLLGGFFLQLAYFGTDQSQVGRILTARSSAESRMGLLANGLLKIPMQFFILLLGVFVYVAHQFSPGPMFANPTEVRRVEAGPHAAAWAEARGRHDAAAVEHGRALEQWLAARRTGDAAAMAAADAERVRWRASREDARADAVTALRATDATANANDTNHRFLAFVLAAFPAGLIGLVLAAVFAAAMNATSSEIHALTTTTIVDVVERIPGLPRDERTLLAWSRAATVFWVGFAVLFAENAGRAGSLVEAVNVLGSLFYGTILGIFLTAFLVRRAGGTQVFAAALVAEVAVLACWKLTPISFLWYNLVGAVLTLVIAALLSLRRAPVPRLV
jgi:SSS family transporter